MFIPSGLPRFYSCFAFLLWIVSFGGLGLTAELTTYELYDGSLFNYSMGARTPDPCIGGKVIGHKYTHLQTSGSLSHLLFPVTLCVLIRHKKSSTVIIP
jgi:hypothetical protein